MIKVSGPRLFERVGGTSLGGGTLWGLLSLLTGARNFEDMLRLAERGDNTEVDMLVGDIYGTDYNRIGLKSTTIASTLGKVFRTKRLAEREAEDHGGMGLHHYNTFDDNDHDTTTDTSRSNSTEINNSNSAVSSTHPAASHHMAFRPEDLSRSLLYAISNNIGQLAYLHAEKHGCEHVYFGGSFIGGHWQTMATLSYAIKFWSKGSKEAYFLRHEGYLGAVGAFLNRQPVNWGGKNNRRASFDELLALSRAGTRDDDGNLRDGTK
jgi:type II pantothenate kinase